MAKRKVGFSRKVGPAVRVLAIDTGAGTSVAAGELVQLEFQLRGFTQFGDPFGHAENIGLAISQTLSAANWQPDSVQLLAANQGPAGYTGLRVGLAAVTAFAAARKLTPVGIGSLAAAAFVFFQQNPDESTCSVALEAKRNELFFQRFRRQNSPLPLMLGEATLLPVTELPHPLPADWVTEPADARAIAELAAIQWQQTGESGGVVPQYLRQPDVTPGPGKRVSG
jgi:tRNA threonylcarbamoyl adenosine modification protein YeaZ